MINNVGGNSLKKVDTNDLYNKAKVIRRDIILIITETRDDH